MAQNMVTPLATSLLHFQLKKMFKNMVCILGLFGLATVLATFQKILGDFFSKSSGHPEWDQVDYSLPSSFLEDTLLE
jgi:hypothetical protein